MDEPEIPDPYCNPDHPIAITFDEVTSAAYRIKSGIRYTECTKSEHLTNLTGMEIYIKKEFLQATGSFKERGARFAMLMLPDELKSKGIVAASAGNHAQACCYHGYTLGIPVTVVMPETAPIMKIQKCRNYKGNVIVQGKTLAESKRLALAYARDNGMMYLNGYDHPQILAGQGTIGLEVWEQVPNIEAVIVPVGGGGLVAGICVAIKALDKNIMVIGVEPERAACLTEAMKNGKPVEVKVGSTLADGLAVAKIGVNSFESIRRILDKCVTVKEQYIALSILRLIEYEKSVVEGAGASGLAAILQGTLPELRGKKVCLILSGGNIDTSVLGRVLDRGLAADGRLVKVKVCVADRVGGIEDLATAIGDLGVHIKDIVHERAWVTEDVFKVEVKVVCECRDREHSLALRDTLAERYGEIVFNGVRYPDEMTAKATAVFAPVTQQQFQQLPSDYGTGSVQQNVIDLESNPPTAVSIQTGSLHPSQQYAMQTGSLHPSQLQAESLHPSQQPGGSMHPSQQPGGSFHPSQQMGGSLHSSLQPMESVHPSVQQGGSLHPSQQPGGSLHPSQLQGGSICQPCGSLHPSQLGGSIHPSQQVGDSLHPSQLPGGSMHPSQQPGGSMHPSQQPTGSICQPCGSIQGSMHPSQQVGGSFHPSQQVTESIQVSQQNQTFAAPTGSFHPSQQSAATQPMNFSQQVGIPLGSAHPSVQSKQTEVNLTRPFSNCACKRRGAPGSYKS